MIEYKMELLFEFNETPNEEALGAIHQNVANAIRAWAFDNGITADDDEDTVISRIKVARIDSPLRNEITAYADPFYWQRREQQGGAE